MRRQMRLIGLILAHAERSRSCGNIYPPSIDGFTEAEILYHVQLCVDAGFVKPRGRKVAMLSG